MKTINNFQGVTFLSNFVFTVKLFNVIVNEQITLLLTLKL